jgi:hypothetical protein
MMVENEAFASVAETCQLHNHQSQVSDAQSNPSNPRALRSIESVCYR